MEVCVVDRQPKEQSGQRHSDEETQTVQLDDDDAHPYGLTSAFTVLPGANAVADASLLAFDDFDLLSPGFPLAVSVCALMRPLARRETNSKRRGS